MQETTQQHSNPAQLPRKASQLASELDLGELRVSFTPQLSDWRTRGYFALLGYDLVHIALGLSLALMLMALFQGVSPSNFVVSLVAGLAGILLVVFNVVFLARLVGHISVWEQGLVIRKVWRGWQVIRWDEVASCQFVGRFSRFIIYRPDGSKLWFHGAVFNASAITSEIEEQLKKHFLPAALVDFEAGKTLTFGPLSVNKEGLHFSEEIISWQRVKEIDTQFVQNAVFISIAMNSAAPAAPLSANDTRGMLQAMGKTKDRAVVRGPGHLLLTPLLPRFSVASALIGHAHLTRE